MIHVCYALHDESGKYSKLAATSMISIFENTAEFVTVHIIIDSSIPKDTIEKLETVGLNYGQYVKFYNVDELVPDRIEEIKKTLPNILKYWASIACIYRLMISRFVPADVSKIIYLDADTLVNRDIKELWNIDMKNFPLAAIPESSNGLTDERLGRFFPVEKEIVDKLEYFNSGVLVFDLDYDRKISEDLFTSSLKFLSEHPRTRHKDQDALNVVYNQNYIQLPNTFNRFVDYARKANQDRAEAKIYHFVGTTLRVWSKSALNRLWFSYFVKTPFCTPRIFWDFRQAIDKYIADYQNIADRKLKTIQHAFKLISERQRVFFIDPNDQKYIAENIGFDGSEIGLNAKSENAVENLISQMKQTNSADSNSKRIFLIKIPVEEYDVVRKRLIEEKFVENEDFVNFNDLFTAPVLDLPRSYKFILQM